MPSSPRERAGCGTSYRPTLRVAHRAAAFKRPQRFALVSGDTVLLLPWLMGCARRVDDPRRKG